MRKLLLTLIATFLTSHLLPSTGYNGPVHLYFNGRVILAEQLERGSVNYFFSLDYEERIIQAGPNSFFRKEQFRVERYFISAQNGLEEITSYNYKELIRKYMPKAPELHRRLGKKGFRFENVRYMIQYYNKFKS